MDRIAKSDQKCAIYHINHSVFKQIERKKDKLSGQADIFFFG